MKCLVVLLLFVIAVSSVIAAPGKRNFKSGFGNVAGQNRKCGYEGCPKPKPGMLNVHLVPHTHDDVGWLKTVDQYYYGSKTLIQKAGVQYILDSVIQSLLRDPEKRFIYVETEFFFKWWKKQTPELQEQVKMLVNEGRLEFIGGAWSMNDEATTHYQSIIDQTTWGLRMLNDTFGECARPRVGWQIDPFGHSREQASIFARMGFDGMFFGRLDHEDKVQRLLTKTPEFIWKASANLGEDADLFTGVLYNNYGPPPGFCFDILCSDDPIIDEKHSPDNNVKDKVDKFLMYAEMQALSYRTNNVMFTMGGDFTFMDAHVYFANMDKLIRYSNQRQSEGSQINLFYSTPSCYLKALHDSDTPWPTKTDDFFPYSSDPHAFWTGYFTSRPTLKRFERVGNHFLQICKQLTATALAGESFMDAHLTFLREQMGIMQHHDAVTGTEKQHVADDYARRLTVGIEACKSNTKIILNQFTTGQIHEPYPLNFHSLPRPPYKNYTFTFDNCLELNISRCEVSENSANFMITMYNPLGYSTFQYVRVPVPDVNYNITDYRGVPVSAQFVTIPSSVMDLSYRFSDSHYEMVFLANELPPMGYKSYYVSKYIGDATENFSNDQPIPTVIRIERDLDRIVPPKTVIGNKYLNLTFDHNNLVESIQFEDEVLPFSQNFFYYEAALGNNEEFINRSSGAYIFRPNSTLRSVNLNPTIEVIRGDLVDEVHQVFNSWVSQVIRVYKDENHIEFEWMVGAIPVDDKIGKEIVTKYMTNIMSDSTFYTDSNGREMLQRKRNYRPTYKANIQEPVAGNYYPITTKIALDDRTYRMAVLTDRAQGGTSMNDGELELMIHRRLLHDDAFGVAEALDEKAFGSGLVARGIHYLVIGKNPTTQGRERFIQAKKLVSPWPFFSDVSSMSFEDWRSTYSNIRSGISLSLPVNIHLMTFEPWRDNTTLLRLEHILEKDEDPQYSKPVTINLKDVFHNIAFDGFVETNLAANQWISDMKETRMKFRSAENELQSDFLEPINTGVNGIEVLPRSGRGIFSANLDVDSVYVNNWSGITDKMAAVKRGRSAVTRNQEEFNVTLKPMEIRTFVLYKDY